MQHAGSMQPETQLCPGMPAVEGLRQRAPRYEELDSLRGLAALVVFVYHCIFLLTFIPRWLELLVKSPAGLLLYGGHQAVILFFLLSGFVLYLPYTRPGARPGYLAFVTKRICRIYLPYLCALVFFVLAYLVCFRPQPLPGFLPEYGWHVLSTRALLTLIRDHVIFIGMAHREYLNGATWTLAEEMRISFLFPLLALMVQRLRAGQALAASLACSALVVLGVHLVHHRFPLYTLHYAGIFVLGAVLARNRAALVGLWDRSSAARRLLVVVAAILVCAYAPYLMLHSLLPEEAADWLIAASASVFLITALAQGHFGAFLRHRTMKHFGRTSYGLYLLHLPVIFCAVNLLWNRIPHGLVYAIAFVTTALLAHLFYHLIERPSMALGKHLARRIDARRPASVVTFAAEAPERAGSAPQPGRDGLRTTPRGSLENRPAHQA